ncbi:hypothetical protein [Streptomyces sp. NPDC021020]|uniref:hypothetical protein n=1 Tax=Streptomyces sp. NPDC021020 TaxID=3365109 RepID=UPI0037BBD47E
MTAIFLAAATLCGCTGNSAPHGTRTTDHRADGPAQVTQDPATRCGVEVPTDTQKLLSPQDVYPAKSGTKSLSTRVLLLTAADCDTGKGPTGIAGTSCSAADFPWASAASQNPELYASGARVWAEAILTGPDDRVLQEHVIVPDAKEKEAFLSGYREHFEQCGARALDMQNGKISDLTLQGSPSLVASFDNDRITVLEGIGPRWSTGELQKLLGLATARGASFTPH